MLIAGCVLAAAVPPAAADEPPPPGHAAALWERDVLTGDWGGTRSQLEDSGIVLGGDSIDEILGNTGGVRDGAIYEGRLELLATVDLDKTLGWTGATFHVNAYQIHGRGLSANDLDHNLLTASSIEAARSTRLFDAWVDQLLFGTTLSLRVGQIAADDEFFTSQVAANFINGSFGWPAILATDLPSGGPAYPLATPGFRLRYAPDEAISLALGVFDGNPAGAGPGDPQRRDGDGLALRSQDGSFVIGEASYATTQDLPATYKIGAWIHTGHFADQRLPLPGTTHDGDYGFYAAADQYVWRPDPAQDRGVALFLRLGGAPADRNEIAFYGDSGGTLKGPLEQRPDDLIGLATAWAVISRQAAAYDAAHAQPIRDHEAVTELFYRVQLTPWWTVQPDLQVVLHPGGRVALPTDGTRVVPDASVLGVRSSVIF